MPKGRDNVASFFYYRIMINVIYEDDSVLVVFKPAGIATQTQSVGAKDLETECKKYRKQKGEKPEIYVVHRLDQPVSGIILFAKTKESAAALTKDMKEDGFLKDYKAKVYIDRNIPKEGTLINYLKKDGKSQKAIISSANDKGAKLSELSYETIDSSDSTATLLIHLKTGRFHQIRVQLSNIGAPIIGDRKYGSAESIAYSDEEGVKNVELTAYHLTFKHPVTGKILDFEV